MGTEEQGAGGQGKEVVRQDRRTGNQESKARRDQGGRGRPMKVDLREGGNTDGAQAAHLKQGHVPAIILSALLRVRAVDEGTALLGVAIT